MKAKIRNSLGSFESNQECRKEHAPGGNGNLGCGTGQAMLKSTKEERIAMAREGKPDREEHKSTTAIRKSKW